MRVAVTGGRTYAKWAVVVRTLSALPAETVLVHGAAPGLDALAARYWAFHHRCPVDPHPADWTAPCRPSCRPGHRRPRHHGGYHGTYCPQAGHYRNQEMVDSGLDMLLCFPGGNGTADMRARCVAAGVRIIDVVTGDELRLALSAPKERTP